LVKIAKTVVLLGAVTVLVFLLAPSARNQFSGVVETGGRRGMESFVLPPVGGGPAWSFEDHKGQVILLNFWATWCPPCRAETPGLVKLHNELAGRGFSVVAIAMDDDPEAVVPEFVREYHMPYPILVPAGFERAGRTDTLPTSLLLDKQGRIARTYTGLLAEGAVRRDVETLLAE
jgi:cytochrome c biogenesis protein CcmG, thiol:disulfide interchange protein DsbE